MISDEAFQYFISKYKPEYCQQLLEHCQEGGSIETFSAKINNIPQALHYWCNKYVEFEVCLRVAYYKSMAYWEDLIIQDSKNIKEFKTLDANILKMVMKHRYNWTDNADDLMMAIGKLSDKELESRARAILDARKEREKGVIDVSEKKTE